MGSRYSTGSNLNTYSALIHNFYSQETAPYPAVHVAMDTGLQEGEQVSVKAYTRSVVSSNLALPWHQSVFISVHPSVFLQNQKTQFLFLYLVTFVPIPLNTVVVSMHRILVAHLVLTPDQLIY